jgi:hypothetical protein
LIGIICRILSKSQRDILARMTVRQRVIVWVWITAIVASGLFPPWEYWSENTVFPKGYYPLLISMNHGPIRVDEARLLIEWILLTAVAGGLYFAWPWGSDRK